MNAQFVYETRRGLRSMQRNSVRTDQDHTPPALSGSVDLLAGRNGAFEHAIVSCRNRSGYLRWDRSPRASSLPCSVSDALSAHQPPESALLIEHRDEIFARLAADLSEHGLQVVRATTACEGLKTLRTCEPRLVIANVGLLDQSAWLFAAKLRLTEPAVPIWLYQPVSAPIDFQMADFLKVNELFNYGGDLFELSQKVMDCLGGMSHRAAGVKRRGCNVADRSPAPGRPDRERGK